MYNLPKEVWEYISRLGFIEEGNERNLAAEGLYYGGDKIVSDQLKPNQYLPFNIEEVVKTGVDSLRNNIIELRNAEQVANDIIVSLKNKVGYSVIRLGDGELMFLAHDYVLSTEEITKDPRFDFLSYAGVSLPNHKTRDILTDSLFQANIVGIPQTRFPTFQSLFNKISHYHHWDLNSMTLASSNINYELNDNTTLYHDLLSNYRVLLIGNRMAEGKQYFENIGYRNIVGAIPVKGIDDVPAILKQTKDYEFDVAFVSSGIPANLICINLAKEGKVAIDFGHLIDLLLMGSSEIITLEKCFSQPNISCKIGDYFFNRSIYETAVKWYTLALETEETLKLNTEFSTWYPNMQLCLCYWNLGQPKKACEHNENAAQYLPKDPSILFNRQFFKDNNVC